MWEFISRKEYQKFFKPAIELIREVQTELRSLLTFQIYLIGSAKYRLVMKNGESPYDFDFTFQLMRYDENDTPEQIRKLFIDAFNKFYEKYGFDKLNNDSRTIKLKYFSNIKNHVDFSIEIAICRKKGNRMEIIKFDKDKSKYIWNEEEDVSNLIHRFKNIKRKGNYWLEFKNIYKKKRNQNQNQKSISIFKETIKEIEDKINLCQKKKNRS